MCMCGVSQSSCKLLSPPSLPPPSLLLSLPFSFLSPFLKELPLD